MYFYVDVVITFATLTRWTETVLTERLGKTTLFTFQQTLTIHVLSRLKDILLTVLLTEV